MLCVPRKDTQLDQEAENRIIDSEAEVTRLNRKVERFCREDSEAGVITEVCTEPSSDSDTNSKVLEKRNTKQATQAVRKHRANVYTDRLRAAFHAGFSLGKEDSEESSRTGQRLALQSRLERRPIVRDLGRSFKRGLSTAVRDAAKKLVSSTSIVHEETSY